MAHIWIDADACPVKEEVIAISRRFQAELIFISSQAIKSLHGRQGFEHQICDAGPDAADDLIHEKAQRGELVVTADLLLAKRLIAKGLHVINFQGQKLTANSLPDSLGKRDIVLAHGGQLPSHSSGKSSNSGTKKKNKTSKKQQNSVFKEAMHNLCSQIFSLKTPDA